jgi:ribonucleoside-diphosphate reductase alpha chain
VEKIKRPDVLPGWVVRKETACGRIYVTVTHLNGRIIEVFATLGKSGGCASSNTEGMTRSASLGLRYGVPVDEIIKNLKGIQCPSPVMFPENARVLSCSDAIGRALEDAKCVLSAETVALEGLERRLHEQEVSNGEGCCDA